VRTWEEGRKKDEEEEEEMGIHQSPEVDKGDAGADDVGDAGGRHHYLGGSSHLMNRVNWETGKKTKGILQHRRRKRRKKGREREGERKDQLRITRR